MIELNYTKDCITDTIPQNLWVTVYSECGDTIPVQLSGQLLGYNFGLGTEHCLNLISCFGGDIPWQFSYKFSGQFFLTSSCSDWKVTYERNQRDTLINATSSSVYIETRNFGICNSTPTIYTYSTRSIVNTPSTFFFSATAPNGDSLVYSLVAPKSNSQSSIQFKPGYSANQPIPGLSLNSKTGKCEFTANQLGEFVLGVKIEAFNKQTSALTSVTLMDYTVWVIEPTNTSPQLQGIQNIQGNATLLSPDTLQVNFGDSFSFDIQAIDVDTNDSISLFQDITQVLPNASFSIINGNPAKISVNWSASQNTNDIKIFRLTAVDDYCFMPVLSSKEYVIVIGNGVNSIHEPDESAISIYPNPTNGVIYLKYEITKVFLVEILDLSGKIIHQKPISSETNYVDLSTLKPGLYILKMFTDQGSVVKKIIKH
jgi:hypothetical protein